MERTTVLRKCLYVLGIFPKVDQKTKTVISNIPRATFYSLVYLSGVIYSWYVFVLKVNHYGVGKFKLCSDVLMQIVVTIWLVGNNTYRCENLTRMSFHEMRPDVKLTMLQIFAAIVVNFGIVISIVSFAAKNAYDTNEATLAFIVEGYSLISLHIMNYGRFLLFCGVAKNFCTLNRTLERLPNLPTLTRSSGPMSIAVVWKLSQIIGDHNSIVNWIDLFNDSFGFETLITKVYELFNVLAALEFLLDSSSENQEATSMLLLWTAYLCCNGLIIAYICERILSESKRTTKLAYNLLHRFDNNPNDSIRKKLLVLSQQAVHRSPGITAWGFFMVDHKMVFMFTNLVVTYVIVIVQFKAPGRT